MKLLLTVIHMQIFSYWLTCLHLKRLDTISKAVSSYRTVYEFRTKKLRITFFARLLPKMDRIDNFQFTFPQRMAVDGAIHTFESLTESEREKIIRVLERDTELQKAESEKLAYV